MDHRTLLIATLALGGCAATGPTSAAPARALEPLYAVTAGREALTVSVSSNGCTKKSDFTIRAHNGRVAIDRIKPDACKSFAMGRTEIVFTWPELGAEFGPGKRTIQLANPLTAWTGPGD